jgi:hypothetical protein
MTYTKPKSITELAELASGKLINAVIQLNFGVISRKQIEYKPDTKRFFIFNGIDGTTQELTAEELASEDNSNINKAIELGALFIEN